MIVKTGKNKNGFQYQISSKYDSLRSKEDHVVFISTDSLAKNLDSVYTHGISKFDSLTARLDFRKDSSGKLRRQVEIKTRKLKRVANKAVQEISTWEEGRPDRSSQRSINQRTQEPKHSNSF